MNSDKSHEVDKVVLHPICHKQVGEVKTRKLNYLVKKKK